MIALNAFPSPARFRATRPRWPTWLLGSSLALAGCVDPAVVRPGDVRTYRVPREAVAAARPAEPTRLPLRYDPPAGWTDRGGSGMRLATLEIGEPGSGHEVTVIPAAGTLEANVARWLGQLDPAAATDVLAERAAAALADAERVDVDGVQATVVLLGAVEGAATGGDAILAAVIPIDESSALFVKFKGPADVARRERDNFVRFVSTVRWK